MATGKAHGRAATLGPAAGRSARLASSIRLIPDKSIPNPAGRPTIREWAGTYSGETADVTGSPWAASAEANAG